MLQILYIVAVGGAIFACDWFGRTSGTYLSTRVLRQEPFNNPLGIPVTPDEIAKAKGREPKNLIKFKSQFWQLVVHVSMSVVETYVLWQTAQLSGEDILVDPVRMQAYTEQNSPFLETVYLVQMAIWIVTSICHIWLFEPQSDYFVMLAHHIVTIALVAISLEWGFLRLACYLCSTSQLLQVWTGSPLGA